MIDPHMIPPEEVKAESAKELKCLKGLILGDNVEVYGTSSCIQNVYIQNPDVSCSRQQLREQAEDPYFNSVT